MVMNHKTFILIVVLPIRNLKINIVSILILQLELDWKMKRKKSSMFI